MRRVATLLSLVLVLAVSEAVIAVAEPVTIERAVSKTVKMYKSPDGKGGRIAKFRRDEVNAFIESQPGNQLKADKDGMMLKVTIEDKTGWIEARTVELKGGSGKVKLRCAHAAAPQALAATRGMGDKHKCD
jgi:hypothetical protein